MRRVETVDYPETFIQASSEWVQFIGKASILELLQLCNIARVCVHVLILRFWTVVVKETYIKVASYVIMHIRRLGKNKLSTQNLIILVREWVMVGRVFSNFLDLEIRKPPTVVTLVYS